MTKLLTNCGLMDSPKTQKSAYLENKTQFFLQIIKFMHYTLRRRQFNFLLVREVVRIISGQLNGKIQGRYI